MKRHTRLHLVALAVWAGGLLAAPAPAAAQAPPPRSQRPSVVEGWIAAVATAWTGTGTLDTSYPPQVALISGAEGRLGQVLTLDPSMGRGFELGVNVLPARSFGFQVFASRAAADLLGRNTPFEIDLRYVSRPPPDNQPTPVQVRRSVDWPDTSGRLRQWTFGAGPAARWHRARVAVVVSGGLAWVRLDGEAEPLGFTTFRLGGHSVLFTEDYRVRAVLGPKSVAAGYVGAALDVTLGPHVAATAGLRVLLAGEKEVPSTIDAIVNATAGLTPPLPSDVERLMTPGPARLSPRSVALAVGIKLR